MQPIGRIGNANEGTPNGSLFLTELTKCLDFDLVKQNEKDENIAPGFAPGDYRSLRQWFINLTIAKWIYLSLNNE